MLKHNAVPISLEAVKFEIEICTSDFKFSNPQQAQHAQQAQQAYLPSNQKSTSPVIK